MQRMIKTSAASAAMAAAVAAILFAMDFAPRTETSGSWLGENALAAARGWSPSMQPVSANQICACLFAQNNPGTGLVCNCTSATLGDPCVVCSGTTQIAGQLTMMMTGYAPAGMGNCNAMTAVLSSCNLNSKDQPYCSAGINSGPCAGTYSEINAQVE